MNETLNQYVQTRSADAFRQIVETHINSVYSQCLRKLHNAPLAEDVAQTVFITLAQKAPKLPPNILLEGWLFTTTRFCCSNAQRAAARRSAAEHKAATMRTESTIPAASDHAISSETEELLDDAIATLPDRDRNAVILRFFGGQSLREVGQTMGVSEDAARQRIFRAVEKLRGYFSAKGITAESATVGAWLSIAVKPASSELTKNVINLTIAKATATAASGTGILSHLAWTWPKIAAGIAASVAVTAAVVVVSNGRTPSPTPAQHQPAQIAASSVTPILADVPAADPKTQPSDQSAPADTLRKLSDAVQNNNRTAINECLCDDGKDPDAAALGRAYFLEQAGVWHLQKAWKDKFKSAMNVPGLNFEDFPGHGTFETMLSNCVDFPSGLEATIDGDTAQIRVPLPRDAFSSPGPGRIAALERWSGAMLVFKQINGNWRLDTERTFNFIGGVARHPGNADDSLAIEAKVAVGLGDGLNAVAAGIESGKYGTRQRVIDAIVAAATKAFKDARVDGTTLMTLPVIGG